MANVPLGGCSELGCDHAAMREMFPRYPVGTKALFGQFEAQKTLLEATGAVRRLGDFVIAWLMHVVGYWQTERTIGSSFSRVLRALSADSAMPVLQADARWWSVDGVHPSGEGYRKLGEWPLSWKLEVRRQWTDPVQH